MAKAREFSAGTIHATVDGDVNLNLISGTAVNEDEMETAGSNLLEDRFGTDTGKGAEDENKE